jgi:predicted Zn-dependent protease
MAEALPLLNRGVELQPDLVWYRTTLGQLLADRRDWEAAERQLRQALVLDPCSSRARLHLSELLRKTGRHAEQVELLEAGDEDCLHFTVVRNALAYALATSPDPALRDGPRALRLAEAAVAEGEGQHPDHIDTLACAYAELGDFERAVAEQRRALAMLEGHTVPDEIVELFQRHLAAFEAGEPVRER